MVDQPQQTHDATEDILTDHEYDGIQEYDNPLPGWWVYLFWLSILFAIPYTMWYHWGLGDSIWDDLADEEAAYAEVQVAKFGEVEPTSENIVTYMNDETVINAMRNLFQSKCAQCHVADGSGQVGPNLTDAYWIHVEEPIDIYTVIKYGVVEKGMTAWDGKLLDTQMVLLSAYVANMGKNPLPGMPPQGNLVEPWPPVAPPPSPADSEVSAEPEEPTA